MKKTKLEKKFQKILELLDLKFVFQFNFNGRLFDFYLKKEKVLIEVDGDFYHSNPNTKHKKMIYEIQKQTRKNDLFKNKMCERSGIKLIRFWEKDINERPDWVMLKLKMELSSQK